MIGDMIKCEQCGREVNEVDVNDLSGHKLCDQCLDRLTGKTVATPKQPRVPKYPKYVDHLKTPRLIWLVAAVLASLLTGVAHANDIISGIGGLLTVFYFWLGWLLLEVAGLVLKAQWKMWHE